MEIEAIFNNNFTDDLPELGEKMSKFVIKFAANKFENASDAYRFAYNCKNMGNDSINVEASKLLKHPKVAPWVKYIKKNMQEAFKNELNYTIKNCFDEVEEIKKIALDSRDKNGNPNVSSALKAVELKGKLAGHFIERQQVENISLAELLDQLQ